MKKMTFKLKIVNRNRRELHSVIGISEERRTELSVKMDEIVEQLKKHSKNKTIYLIDSLDEIGKICNDLEEYTYCIFTHTFYLATIGAIENIG